MAGSFANHEERIEFHKKARVVSTLMAPLFVLFLLFIISLFVGIPFYVYPMVYLLFAFLTWIQAGNLGKRELALHEDSE